MAKPAATHVIEIETGIGEPAFIPLTLGQELQPISVGRKGMWKIESARVLDVHAFVYFDGSSLFLQSADEHAAASVDGVKVGKTWTELHAPCKIDVGTARLRFRSLVRDRDEDVVTTAHAKAPVAAPGGSPRPAAGAPPESAPPSPPPTSKPARPFKPGEFSTPADEEATRLAPVDASRSGPRPAAGRPAESDRDVGARTEGSGRSVRPPPPQEVTVGMVGAPVKPPPGMGPPSMSAPVYPAPMPSAPMMHPMGPAPSGSVVSTMPPGMMMSGASGAYPQQYAMPPGQPMQGYGVRQAPPPPGGADDLLAKYKDLSLPKKILVVLAPFCVLAAAYLLFAESAPSTVKTTVKTNTEAGAPVATASAAVSPCPSGFVPLPGYAVAPGGAVPCIPSTAVTAPAPPAPSSAAPATSDTGRESAPAPPPAPPGQRTLERQAVDYVAVGDYARAAAAYEELLRKNPDNRVYAEAARILRAKVDGGAP